MKRLFLGLTHTHKCQNNLNIPRQCAAFSLTENVDFNNGLFMQKLFASFEEREIFRAETKLRSLLIPVEKKGVFPGHPSRADFSLLAR